MTGETRAATTTNVRAPPQARLVHHVATNGKMRVLMSNLFDTARFPVSAVGAVGDLYHKCWRIDEAFKWLKHQLNLKQVSGLSQQHANECKGPCPREA